MQTKETTQGMQKKKKALLELSDLTWIVDTSNIQKPIAFLYTSNGQLKIKNFKTYCLAFRLQQVSNDCSLTEISIRRNIHMPKYLHKS